MVTRSGVAAAALLAAVVAGCSKPAPPIDIQDNVINIDNQTSRGWRNVVVTVNDHYRGGAARLEPGGRLNAPLSEFQTGYGQRFPAARVPVFKIEVTATSDNGEPVNLLWGASRK